MHTRDAKEKKDETSSWLTVKNIFSWNFIDF
jgi:hypothetical protein